MGDEYLEEERLAAAGGVGQLIEASLNGWIKFDGGGYGYAASGLVRL